MSEGRDEENTGNTSCQNEEGGALGQNIGSGENRGEISEGQSMSTDCVSPIGKSSNILRTYPSVPTRVKFGIKLQTLRG